MNDLLNHFRLILLIAGFIAFCMRFAQNSQHPSPPKLTVMLIACAPVASYLIQEGLKTFFGIQYEIGGMNSFYLFVSAILAIGYWKILYAK